MKGILSPPARFRITVTPHAGRLQTQNRIRMRSFTRRICVQNRASLRKRQIFRQGIRRR